MLQFLAPLLGGLGGMLFPAAAGAAGAAATGAAATGIGALLSRVALPAIGAGLGTLAVGGGGKDAIRNALLMGAGAGLFPGVGEAVRGSALGKNITGGLGSLFGMVPPTGGPVTTSAPPPPRPAMGSRPPLPRPGDTPPPGAAPMMDTGLSGMEMEARGRPSTSVLPSVSQMVNTVRPTISRTSLVTGRPEGLEVSPMPYGSLRGVRPEGLEMPLDGMTSDIVNQNQVRRRYYGTDPGSPEGGQAAIDFLLSLRSPRLRGEMLLPGYTPRTFAVGGAVEGPGTGTSDSIPATIFQDGKPVQKAALSDGEFVMTAQAVKGAGNGNRDRGISRMYELMRRFERGEMA